MSKFGVVNGDCREVMARMPGNSIDSIVTDPPYGLEFMGKGWDHGVPGEEFWREALRIAKPGAHLLAFGGTRTFHRLATAIEDAGWEIRDTIMWVYGTGFPKSLNVARSVESVLAGSGGRYSGKDPSLVTEGGEVGTPGALWDEAARRTMKEGADAWSGKRVAVRSDDAAAWSGWGTALKPAAEYIVVAQKSLDVGALCASTAQKIAEAVCRCRSSALGAGEPSTSRTGARTPLDSARWSVVPEFSSRAGLFEVMGTLRSASEMPSCLSTALSWLDILGAIWTARSTFTIETATSLTTDLKILNSFPLETMQDAIAGVVTSRRGTTSSAALVESVFNVVAAKLHSTLTPSAPGFATSQAAAPGLSPDWEPIIVARKPLDGTVASNVLKHGTGGINVDACRVGMREHDESGWAKSGSHSSVNHAMSGPNTERDPKSEVGIGRWPANLVHDGSDEVLELFPHTKSGELKSAHVHTVARNVAYSERNPAPFPDSPPNEGSAARFFYCAKASPADRDEGLDAMPVVEGHDLVGRKEGTAALDSPRTGAGRASEGRKNIHPTVKPTDLMRWLVRLVTPPGGTVLDPFAGSCSTGKAAILEGFNAMMIEQDEKYAEIGKARMEAASKEKP